MKNNQGNVLLENEEDIHNYVKNIKNYKMTTLEKFLDKLEDVYYTLGGRYLDAFKFKVKNQFSGLVRFAKGQGYVTDMDIYEFPSQSAKMMVQRLKLVKENITSGNSCCDWEETLKCCYPDEKDSQGIIEILDDIIFAFQHIADEYINLNLIYKEKFGITYDEALDVLYDEAFSKKGDGENAEQIRKNMDLKKAKRFRAIC
jgi:hypothetical protein